MRVGEHQLLRNSVVADRTGCELDDECLNLVHPSRLPMYRLYWQPHSRAVRARLKPTPNFAAAGVVACAIGRSVTA